MKKIILLLILILLLSCNKSPEKINKSQPTPSKTSIVILGTIQDAGSPHIACTKDCCKDLFDKPDNTRQVVSLGVYDASTKKRFLFEATPDMPKQLNYLLQYGEQSDKKIPDGVFLTHAHIGHYTGLMYFGKEAMSADRVPVFAMPKMKDFLETNGPWSQLVSEKNIVINQLKDGESIQLSNDLKVTPYRVPHRDEYSETVGCHIQGPNKSALFIPDIDKWEKWEKSIIEEIKKVDYAFLDATFYDGVELNNRDISQIPHPFVIESIEKFKDLNKDDKRKIIFIHFNHTNPILNPNSSEAKNLIDKGFRIAKFQEVFEL
ncbi:MAG: pyrroloquinoline quinone biosynthesis protein PqqB [Ignavibacteriae bacterium HGW-Ignavibacteriae-4]|jgi:pyrroloquinoline quinone biosynthesis protein B|nr:MAG: pyrroloquinoline quinone biosynthesis protein PqqB [Ignavibacteriae bacterium HGW-Ignavibacteriae-4]